MSGRNSNTPTRAIAVRGSRVLSDSRTKSRSVRSGTKHWQPPEGLSRARISEALALRPRDVQCDSVRVLALRASRHGAAGEAAPVHPHLFRHARVRQILRSTRNLPLAQRQASWSHLQLAYLTIGDDEARRLTRELAD